MTFPCLCVYIFVLNPDGIDCRHGIMTEEQIHPFRACLPVNIYFNRQGQLCIFLKHRRRSIYRIVGPFTHEARYLCVSSECLSLQETLSANALASQQITPSKEILSTQAVATATSLSCSQQLVSCLSCLPCTQVPIASTSTLKPISLD